MNDALSAAIIAVALLMAGWSFLLVARNRGPQLGLLVGLGLLEALLLVQVVVSISLAGGGAPAEGVNFVAYLATAVLLVPGGTLWALTDRSRYGPAVLGVVCLVVPVLVVRLQQLWDGTGA
jgi:hypothetical protein